MQSYIYASVSNIYSNSLNSYSYNQPSTSFLSLTNLCSSLGSKLFSGSNYNSKSNSFFSQSFLESRDSKPTDTISFFFSTSSLSVPIVEYKTVSVSMDILNETSDTFSEFKQFILITSFSNLLNIDSKNIFVKRITDKYITNALRFLSISGVTLELDFRVEPSLAISVSDDIMYIFQSGSLENELSSNGLSIDVALNELYIDQNPIMINDDLIGGDDDLIVDDDDLLIGSGDEKGDGDSDDYNATIIGSTLGSFFLIFAILGAFFYRKRLHRIKISIPAAPFMPNEVIVTTSEVANGPNLNLDLPYVKNGNGIKMDIENRFNTVA